mgnify:CR=1 FL=1
MAEKVRCVIICGSPDTNAEFIKSFVKDTDYVICADSGYKTALSAGIEPDLFVGDFDSYSGEVKNSVEIVKLNTHKDDSDSMHCANLAFDRGFTDVALVGASGGRLDHTLANLYVLRYLSEKGVKASLESDKETVQFLTPGEYNYKNKGKTFSVFPFACDKTVVSYEGDVEYTASSLCLNSSQVVGLSNIFLGDNVKVRIISGNALIIVNKVSNSNI